MHSLSGMIDKVLINTDGGARNNPGPAAIGIVIWDENHAKLEEYKERIGDTTNNVAEYKALIKALEIAIRHTSGEVHVFMDSQLVVRQVTGQYRIKAQHLRPLFQKVKDAESSFAKVMYDYVSRYDRYQVEADKLVNDALDGR